MKLLSALLLPLLAEFINVVVHALARWTTNEPLIVDGLSWFVTAAIATCAGWVVIRRIDDRRFLTLKTAGLFWIVGIVAIPSFARVLEYLFGRLTRNELADVLIAYLTITVPIFFLTLGFVYIGTVIARGATRL